MSSKTTSKEFANSLFFALSDADILCVDVCHEISKTIIKKRISLGLTQKEFAKKLGVSQGMVSKLENGSNNYTISTLALVADKLDMTLRNPLHDMRISDNYNIENNGKKGIYHYSGLTEKDAEKIESMGA